VMRRKIGIILLLGLVVSTPLWIASVGDALTADDVWSVKTNPYSQVYVQHTQTTTSPNNPPIWQVTHTQCAGCIGRGYYAQGEIESGSSSGTWMINFESSPRNRIGDFGYQVGATAVNSNNDVTSWSGALSIAYRASAGIGGAYGCQSGVNCFPPSVAFDVVPNGSRFHTGLLVHMGATIDRDILLRSEAWGAIEIWNKAGSTRNVGVYFAPAGTINVGMQFAAGTFGVGVDFIGGNFFVTPLRWPSSWGGGGNRVLCVDNSGNTFRGATSNSC